MARIFSHLCTSCNHYYFIASHFYFESNSIFKTEEDFVKDGKSSKVAWIFSATPIALSHYWWSQGSKTSDSKSKTIFTRKSKSVGWWISVFLISDGSDLGRGSLPWQFIFWIDNFWDIDTIYRKHQLLINFILLIIWLI